MLFQLSVLLLCSLSFSVLAHNEAVTFALAPHSTPSHHPVGAPSPHGGHHHHHHHHYPKHPLTPPHPVKPPAKAPTLPPATPPSPPPSYPVPPRKLVAVQGVVYCKSCKYIGIDTLTGATALANATVKLVCANTKHHLIQESKTDKNGYFFIMPQKLTTDGSHKCKVYLASSPLDTCNVATDLHSGRQGAILMPTPTKSPVPTPLKAELFTVGPFAFEPTKKC